MRLTAAALCLLAAGAATISLVSALTARGYLQTQADRQLRACAGQLLRQPFTASPLYGAATGTSGVIGFSDGLSMEVRGRAGQVVMRTGLAGRPGSVMPAVPAAAAARAGQPATVAAAGGSWRVISEPIHYRARRIPFSFSPEGFDLAITSTARQGLAGTLLIGLNLPGASHALGGLVVGGLAASGVLILAVACLAMVACHAVMRPVTQAITAFTTGQRSRRIPERYGGEAGRLAVSLNTMLSQLEQAFAARAASEAAARAARAQMCRILAETGHQLRRPLNIIGGIAGSSRRGQPSAAELDRRMRRVADEAAHIDALLQQLPHPQSDRPPSRP